jgi:hypothetical protein
VHLDKSRKAYESLRNSVKRSPVIELLHLFETSDFTLFGRSNSRANTNAIECNCDLPHQNDILAVPLPSSKQFTDLLTIFEDIEDNVNISNESGIHKLFTGKKEEVGNEVQNLRANRVALFGSDHGFYRAISYVGLAQFIPHNVKINAFRRRLTKIFAGLSCIRCPNSRLRPSMLQ